MIRAQLRVAVGVLAGGFLAALLPIAVASADDFEYLPDPTTLVSTSVSGMPPFTPLVETGTETWYLYDITTGLKDSPIPITGVDTFTQFGSFTNDLIGVNSVPGNFFDLTDFGGGWGNEWIDFLTPEGGISGASDLLTTPFGDFVLFGDFPFMVP